MIKIICLGKIREKYLNDGLNEYLKRLDPFTKWAVIELKEETKKDISANLLLEARMILSKISKDDFVITLDLKGTMLNSSELANLIELKLNHHPKIIFLIGSSHGFDDLVRARSDYILSFSKMTMPHQLFRLVLVEQIYRSFCIINNREYHK